MPGSWPLSTTTSIGVAVERAVQLGARRAGDAVHRPRPALLGERAVVGRMPVARRDDEVVVAGAGEVVQPPGDRVAVRDRQRAARAEVVLEVDDDEGACHADYLRRPASTVAEKSSSP